MGRSNAFTLLELVVVVAILAIVSTIAIRTTSDLEQQGRWDSSAKALDDIRVAILGIRMR